jgi:aryl-alcohol dehydrogenase-like predicted oxidoreductase/enamine deaminase RidA (YjgF/YER057c/UK114 family)
MTQQKNLSSAQPTRCELAPGFTISRLLTGLWQVADLERDGSSLDPETSATFLAPYADAGFTTFDMADHYGSAEIIAGRFRKQHPEEGAIQLLTKWVPTPGAITRADVRAATERALDRLQSDHIDLLQYHAWNYADPRWLDGLFYLQELREEGLIRHLGVTNFDTTHLRIAVTSGIDIVSNQVCYSLLDQRAKAGMTELCLEHGIHLLAFGTVAGGFLTERWLGVPQPDAGSLATWSQMKYFRFIRETGGWGVLQELLRAVHAAAQHHQVSMANIVCRYILEQPAVGGIIIGARLGHKEHIQDNRRLFEFSLDETSQGLIEEALNTLSPIPGDCGDEYRKPPFLTASGDLSDHLDSIPPPYETQPGPGGRVVVQSGTEWEDLAGFSRAVRHGDRIMVSGTTATHRDRAIGGTDPAAQFHFVIDKIEGTLNSLGAKLSDVVRTRIFVRNAADWEAVARAHGERFREVLPANTLVEAALIGDEYLVEVEAEALVGSE